MAAVPRFALDSPGKGGPFGKTFIMVVVGGWWLVALT
jgi:hypothetical protein